MILSCILVTKHEHTPMRNKTVNSFADRRCNMNVKTVACDPKMLDKSGLNYRNLERITPTGTVINFCFDTLLFVPVFS
jgi:hypothetical protein